MEGLTGLFNATCPTLFEVCHFNWKIGEASFLLHFHSNSSDQKLLFEITNWRKGGSPGPVVMGGDSCYQGRGFESQCYKVDGHFFTFMLKEKPTTVRLFLSLLVEK